MKSARAALYLATLMCVPLCFAQVAENVRDSRSRFVQTSAVSEGAVDAGFGTTLAADRNGDLLVVGAMRDVINGVFKTGAAFVIQKTREGQLQEVAELTASDEVGLGLFGIVAMSCDGKTIVVGALNSAGANFAQGSAYVFVEPAGGWKSATETAKLTASDGRSGDDFGNAIALGCDGRTVFIGAGFASTITGSSGPGAVYVFHRPENGWKTTSHFSAKLTASDGLPLDFFGGSLSLSKDAGRLLVGAPNAPFDVSTFMPGPGAAYLFVRPDGGWTTATETAKLTGSDTAGAQYGNSVALDRDGTIALVGAPFDGTGAAYLFVKPAGRWVSATESAKLTASDGKPQDGFGFSVGIAGDGDEVFVGAPLNNLNPGTSIPQGTAYVYDKPWDGWASTSEFQQKLRATEAVAVGEFGWAIALSGKTFAVGAPVTGPSLVGSVYVFEERHDEH